MYVCMYIYIYLYIYIYKQETSVSMCCVVKINKKHNVCLTNFCILLILSHVCESVLKEYKNLSNKHCVFCLFLLCNTTQHLI